MTGVVVGCLSAVSASMIHRMPKMPKEVARLHEIDKSLDEPRFSLEDINNKGYFLSAQAQYDSLQTEKQHLIDNGILNQTHAYEEISRNIEKKLNTRGLAGLAITIPSVFGIIFYKPRRREEEPEEIATR